MITQQQIYNNLLAAKTAESDLNGLTSTSVTAIWRLWLYLVSEFHYLMYKQWDVVKVAIALLGLQQIVGTKLWYQGLALNWSGGGQTIIAAHCTEVLTTLDKRVFLFVAADDGNGQFTNLTSADRTALQAYINEKKVAGTDIVVISSTADLLWLGFSVKFAGPASNQAQVAADVKQAILDYISALDFGVPLSISLLSNHLFSVPDVLDVTWTSTQVDTGSGYVSNTNNLITPTVGYFEIGKSQSNTDLIDLNMYQ